MAELIRLGRRAVALTNDVIDDDGLSNLAKLAYWFLERHDSWTTVDDVARGLKTDRTSAEAALGELDATGYVNLAAMVTE